MKASHPFDVELTPASERILAAASQWHRAGEPRSFPELLMGILAEPELRGASLLAEHGVDVAAVRARWPELQWEASPGGDSPPAPAWSQALHLALRGAAEQFGNLSPPLALASEHLLLCILISNSEAAAFLARYGLQAEAIVESTCRQYDISQEPLAWDGLDAATPANAATGAHAPTGPATSQPAETADAMAMIERESTDKSQGDSGMPTDKMALRAVPSSVWRVLDAAGNRAREAARVLEDYCRFALDDRHLTESFKALRHELAAALEGLPAAALAGGRDTPSDVGTTLTAEREQHRGSLGDVVAANSKRLQESLRSLEEYGKLVSPAVAAACKALRYRSYTLERAVQVTANNRQRLAAAQLYVLLDGRTTLADFETLAAQLIAAGVDVIQLRDKHLDDRSLLNRALRLRELAAGSNTLVIINDRPDLAVLADADGVHVGQDELPVAQARRIVGAEKLVGLSTHQIEQAREAVLKGADYIGVGPTFPSGTKAFDAFAGLDYIQQVAREITLPAFAIGGITLENLDRVLAAGARRVAVAGGILSHGDPAQAAQAFLEKLRAFPAEA